MIANVNAMSYFASSITVLMYSSIWMTTFPDVKIYFHSKVLIHFALGYSEWCLLYIYICLFINNGVSNLGFHMGYLEVIHVP